MVRGTGEEVEDIRRRLEEIADELAELAMQRLRDEIEVGATGPPGQERRLTRARRAVEKAVAVLSEPG